MQARCLARLKKEVDDLHKNYHETLEVDIRDESYTLWHVKFKGAEGSVYAGEPYTL